MRKKLKLIALFVCVMLVGAVVPSFAIELKVGLILPGTVTDYGWDYAPIIALNALEANMPDMVVAHRYAELVAPADAEGVMMDLIAAGYNWIWAWGFQYREAVFAVEKKAGKGIYFTINEGTPGDTLPGRIEVIEEYPEGTAYLAGIVAAAVSKTKILGGVLGMTSKELELAEAGFVAGAKAYTQNIKYRRVIVGGWADPEGGRRGAEALLKAGVDVILCQGDGTSLGVIEAVKQARSQGKDVHYIGYPVDQSILAPGNVLTSLSYDYLGILTGQTNDIIKGRFGKGGYVMTLGKGIELAPFYNFDSLVPNDAKDLIAKSRKRIIEGTLKVPTTR